MEKIRSYKQLKIWQKGMEVVKEIYVMTREFPKDELYGLTSQMRRSAVSIPTNIAEGFKRIHSKEYRQFLHISLGSTAELETLMIIANELKFIKGEKYEELTDKLNHISRMINSLKNKLKF